MLSTFLLGIKYRGFKREQANLQTILLVIFFAEDVIAVSDEIKEKEQWILLIPFLSHLGSFTYSKLSSLLSYLICLLYITIRTNYAVRNNKTIT